MPAPRVTWMEPPERYLACPPGLEFLTALDHLLVHQHKEPLEVWTGIETQNLYSVKNKNGEQVYWALEKSDPCARCCFGKNRTIDISAFDSKKRQVLNIYRGQSCFAAACQVQTMDVYSPPGSYIGSVDQEFAVLYPKFNLKNASGDTVIYVEGPLLRAGLFSNVNFKVFGANGTPVGEISKQWGGMLREMFTDADTFGVSFPVGLDVRMKAVVLAATFLIDFTYYEH